MNLGVTLQRLSGACLCVLAIGSAALGQEDAQPTTLPLRIDSGPVVHSGSTPGVVISFPVHVRGAQWLRLQFEHVQLSGSRFAGNNSILRMTSVRDAEVQELDEEQVQQWQQTSAYFNGGTVLVEVVAQPGTGINHVILSGVSTELGPVILPESLCGPDDRVPSSDPRVARLMPVGCTAFIVESCVGCFLTNVNCAQPTTVVQFQVPPSDPNGGIAHPPVHDQYAVDPASIQNLRGTWSHVGFFGTFPNTTTGLTARQAQGAGFTLGELPTSPRVMVIGYGADSTPPDNNRVQQISADAWIANFCSLNHLADTEDGSPGSPIVEPSNGTVVGVHDRDGCGTPGNYNWGHLICCGCGVKEFLANPKGVCKVGPNAPGGMPGTLVTGVPTPVQIELSGAMVFGTAMLNYRFQPGPFLTQQLTNIGGGMYQGVLPAATCLDAPEWYFSVVHPDCGQLTLPVDAPTSTFAATVVNDIFTYCTAKPGLACGYASIFWFGAPSASATNGFFILADRAQPNRTGLVLYTNAGPNNQPFQGGTLCVSTTGLRRSVPVTSSNLGGCKDEFIVDMNAFAAGQLGGNPAAYLSVPGTEVFVQWWGRDTVATGSFLSDALHYRVCK